MTTADDRAGRSAPMLTATAPATTTWSGQGRRGTVIEP